MAEREVILDQPVLVDDQAEAVRTATERAERAEAELAKLKNAAAHGTKPAGQAAAKSPGTQSPAAHGATPQPASDAVLKDPPSPNTAGEAPPLSAEEGEAELRNDSMMAHLLDSLADGKDIGHYGRLTFAMVARHFLSHEELLRHMTQDPDVSEEKATLMLRQVEGKDYTPPKRDRILQWQKEQEFPILPNPEDPDCGNLYRNLKFPDEVYQHIGHYQEKKIEAGE